jgi:voltage-gated potassium channel
MDERQEPLAKRLIERRIARKGLRPRVAAGVIATLWLVAVVIFGIAEHLVDPETFGNVWLGMWWATQTVTTVGYGDVVPNETAGMLMGTVLMIGGLSLFSVITGAITSAFVARAQQTARDERLQPMADRLERVETMLAELRTELGQRDSGSTD